MRQKGNNELKKLRVWLIQHGEPPPTIPNLTSFRTARLSKELASRGHDVTYWCSSFWHHKKIFICQENKEVQVNNYKLNILHAGKYNSNHSISRYFHHRRMAKQFSKEARNRDHPDIIIAALPIHYCAYEAVRFGKENRIPVIVDIRDYWPDNYLMLFPKRFRWLGRLVFRNDFKITKIALQNATALVSMMSKSLEWGCKNYAERNLTSDDRVFFIGGDEFNTRRFENIAQIFPELEGRTEGRFIVYYIGSFSFLNHPLIIIEAAKYLNSIGYKDRILFLLAGMGDYYKRCVNAANGLDNVMFLGWVDTGKMAALNSISSVGIIPSFEEFSFPNKAFSYLGGGLPILSSEQGDLKHLLEKYNAGSYFNISDPIQLANEILNLSQLDDDAYAKISENAKSLFRDHLQADAIYRKYADYVEHIARKYGFVSSHKSE